MPSTLGIVASHKRNVAAPTGPPVTTGFAGWYDASQLTGANGSRITTWPDLSGLGRHLTGPVGPALTAAGLNGKSVATFTGTASNTLAASIAATVKQFFVVAKYNATTFPDYDGLLTGTGEPAILIGDASSSAWWTGTSIEAYYKDGVLYPQPWPAPMQTWAVLAGSHSAFWGTFTLQLGMDRGNSGRWWNGGVAEVIVYDRILSTVERQQVETYLTAKWLPPAAACTDVLTEPFNNLSAWTVDDEFTKLSIVAGRTGTAVRFADNVPSITYKIATPSQSDTLTLGFAVRVSTLGSNIPIVKLFSDAGATEHCYLRIETSGAVSFLRSFSSNLGTSATGLITINTWHYVEIQTKLGDSPNGTATVRVNGTPVLTLTGIDNKNGGTSPLFQWVRFKNESGTNVMLLDDLYLSTGSGCAFKGPITIP